MTSKKNITRCTWCESNDLMRAYHDAEWGVPLHDDQSLFEFLILDTFQAGLSWNAVLQKRKNFEKAFDKFDAKKISKYTQQKMDAMMLDAGIIRNKLKIKAAVTNAQAFLSVQKEFGTFDAYIWSFTKGKTITNKIKSQSEFIATSPESDAMSKDLYKRGFKFVGSTICYAFMQAAGMVNDHMVSCYRYSEVKKLR